MRLGRFDAAGGCRCIEDRQLEPVCKAGFRIAGVADLEPGAFEPRALSDHRGFALWTMKGDVGIVKVS